MALDRRRPPQAGWALPRLPSTSCRTSTRTRRKHPANTSLDATARRPTPARRQPVTVPVSRPEPAESSIGSSTGSPTAPAAGSRGGRARLPAPAARRRAAPAPHPGPRQTRIIEQLLVVTVPAMFLAQRGIPPVGLVAATLLGGAMAAASAHALNCVADADIDVKMKRTARRPLAQGQVPPRHALVFGLVLGLLSAVWLAFTTNLLAA